VTGVGNVGVLYGERFGSKYSLSQSEGESDGVGAGQSTETGCGGQ
jgi:hypothetical protein